MRVTAENAEDVISKKLMEDYEAARQLCGTEIKPPVKVGYEPYGKKPEVNYQPRRPLYLVSTVDGRELEVYGNYNSLYEEVHYQQLDGERIRNPFGDKPNFG